MILLRGKLSLSEYRLVSLRGTARSSVVFTFETAVGFEVGGWRTTSLIGPSVEAIASLLVGLVEPETVFFGLVNELLLDVLDRTRNRLDRTCRGRADFLFVMSAILLSMNLILRYLARDSRLSIGLRWLWTWTLKGDALCSFFADDPTGKPFKFAGERSIVPLFPGLFLCVKNNGRSGKMTVSLIVSIVV